MSGSEKHERPAGKAETTKSRTSHGGPSVTAKHTRLETLGPYLLLVDPVPFARPRPRARRGIPLPGEGGRFYTPGAQEFRTALAQACMVAGLKRHSLAGPVTIHVEFHVKRRGTVDLDNLVKSLLDGLVAIGVLADDTIDVVPEINARARRTVPGEPGMILLTLIPGSLTIDDANVDSPIPTRTETTDRDR
jgi:Holliday junction resolvase RusA-like endonuclease